MTIAIAVSTKIHKSSSRVLMTVMDKTCLNFLDEPVRGFAMG